MAKKDNKTNAMRILDRMKISYEVLTHDCDNFVDGLSSAAQLNLPVEQVFKTIVTTGKSKAHYVFVLPVDKEIDFKKAAKSVGEKSLEMLSLQDITPLTGYVRGGCTAIGMKKQFPVVIDDSANAQNFIYISAGKLGVKLCLKPEDFCKAANGKFAEITFN